MNPKSYNYDEYEPMWLGQGSAHSISDHETRDNVEELRLSVEEITGKQVKRERFGFIR